MVRDVKVRKFVLEELKDVKSLIDKTIETSYSEYPEEYRKHLREDHHSKERILSEARKGYTIVLEYKGKIVGTGTLLDIEIQGVFIQPSYQRKGFGKLIMQKLEEQASVKGIKILNLFSTDVSKGFYDSIGYTTIYEYFTAGTGQNFRSYFMKKEI